MARVRNSKGKKERCIVNYDAKLPSDRIIVLKPPMMDVDVYANIQITALEASAIEFRLFTKLSKTFF